MKLCLNCHRTSAGKPTFCNFCGASYNVRLCPRLHINPRSAEVCSQCGSRDLSAAQPKPSLLIRPLLLLLSISPGVLLLAGLAAVAVAIIQKLFSDPNGLLPLTLIGFALGLLFFLWMLLPNFLKKFIKRLLTNSSKGRPSNRYSSLEFIEVL